MTGIAAYDKSFELTVQREEGHDELAALQALQLRDRVRNPRRGADRAD